MNSWEKYMMRICDDITEIKQIRGTTYEGKYRNEPCIIKFEFKQSPICDTRIFTICNLDGKVLQKFYDII